MFYKTGVKISNAKSMFNFLSNHFIYDTMNSWNGLKSIANNVKLHNLDLKGDWIVARSLLIVDNYNEVSSIIHEWEEQHKGYSVGFNGRSGGYLVLTTNYSNKNVIPDYISDYDYYEDFKENIIYYFDTVKNYMSELVKYTKLVQDFDKLCDKLRDYVNELSTKSFNKIILPQIVDNFNDFYSCDLEALNIEPIKLTNDGKNIQLGKVGEIKILLNALLEIMHDDNLGYETIIVDNTIKYNCD